MFPIISKHREVVEACMILAERSVSPWETFGQTVERTGGKRLFLDDSNAGREG